MTPDNVGSALSVFALVVLIQVLRMIHIANQKPVEPSWTPAALQNELERLEVLLLEGRFYFVGSGLAQIETPIQKLQGRDVVAPRILFKLLAGELMARTHRESEAKALLSQALNETVTLDDSTLGMELGTRAAASLALLTTSHAPEESAIERAKGALANEARIRRPDVLARLACAAHHLAEIEHHRGRWDVARPLLEQAVAIARRPEFSPDPSAVAEDPKRARLRSTARVAASEAARDLGLVFGSLGDREKAMCWLDEAIALVEGAEPPAGRLRLAQALIERASNEKVDAFTGISRHEALFERAVSVARSCDSLAGKQLACDAEIWWASLYETPHRTDRHREHLRRALELAGGLEEPSTGHYLTYLHMTVGLAALTIGDSEEARAALQRAVEAGRGHPDPKTRTFAVRSAYHLHRLLFEEDRIDAGRACTDTIERLVPTLEADERLYFAGLAAHSRGMQELLEDRPDDACRSLAQAETIAREVGPAAGSLTRAIVMDLARIELDREHHIEAERHLRRALEIPVSGDGAGDQALHAEISLLLARALGPDRPEEGLRECSRAFELGRNAGDAKGREIGAVAAMWLGDASDEPDRRRRYFQAARRLGRLCGSARGRGVAETAEARLRELPD